MSENEVTTSQEPLVFPGLMQVNEPGEGVKGEELAQLPFQDLPVPPEPPKPAPKVTDLRVQLLQIVQNNIFTDVALQSLGYCLLSAAVTRYPDLNSPDSVPSEREVLFDGTFDPGRAKTYRTGVNKVVHVALGDLVANADDVVEKLGYWMRKVMEHNKIVPGTFRIYTQMDTETRDLNFSFVWVEII